LNCFRDATGKFPDFPDEDEGGSSAIFKEKTLEEVEAELNNKVTHLYTVRKTNYVVFKLKCLNFFKLFPIIFN